MTIKKPLIIINVRNIGSGNNNYGKNGTKIRSQGQSRIN